MSVEERHNDSRRASATLAICIDSACDRFEAEWRAGRRPRIEVHLDGTSGPEREALVRELLAIEVDWRRRLGERPVADEYGARFPGYAGAIAEAMGAAEPHLATARCDPADTAAAPSRGARSRFRVLRPHARGGLGAVFVAEDTDLHREVALKEIQAAHAHDPDSRARFLFEAEVTGGLEHPGVVPVYGLGSYADGRPYYVMRLVQGDSLKDAIARFHHAAGPAPSAGERALAFRGLLRRLVDVCNAVAFAHSRGVLHRDLKPSNILLGPFGETLVVDWGLAKVLGRTEADVGPGPAALRPSSGSGLSPTVRGAALGTPAYMSPEQAAGRIDDLSPASDVYSLGAVLYHLLTGRAPREGTAEQILGAAKEGAIVAPRTIDAAIDPALEAACLKAMAADPAGRYPGPRALAADIERWLAGEPVTAWREPLARRARRWAQRHRTAVTTAAAAALGPDHPDTLMGRNNFAAAYNAAGRTAEAIALHQATLKGREAVLGPDHPDTLTSRNNLAAVYDAAGRWAEAEPLRREVLNRHRKTVPPDSPALAGELARLAMSLTGQTKWAEAEPVLRECLAIRTQAIPDDWTRFNAMSSLGGALLAQGRHAEAEPLIVGGYEGLKARAGSIPPPGRPRLAEALERVVRLYEPWGQPGEAARRRTTLGPADLPADVFASP